MAVAPGQATRGARGEAVALRAPARVMDLVRLGSLFATRVSFTRTLVRRMAREGWRISCPRFQVDARGVGQAVFAVDTPAGRLGFVAFCEHLEPRERTDRVIATRWDATFALLEGDPDADTVARLAAHVPRQEAGRVSPRELVLSRANRSVRLFEHVVDALAAGRQPEPAQLARVGYLMRTTAVYGNGKFGLSDLARLQSSGVFRLPFQAEMLTVYLARHFSLALVEHLARARAPDTAVALEPRLARALGVGNATGLGMAPFLVTHPQLVNRWLTVRETALARARGIERASAAQRRRFPLLLERARRHLARWHTDDPRQGPRIHALRRELDVLAHDWRARADTLLDAPYPFDALFRQVEGRAGTETEELVASLLIELASEVVDDLENETGCEEDEAIRPGMTVGGLLTLLERDYAWALQVDFAAPASRHMFWYVSEDKEEPRLGERGVDAGDDREMRLDVARQVQALHRALAATAPAARGRSVASWLLREPDLRGIVARVQTLAGLPYAEIRANLLAADCVAVDLLRCKLATFGATGFDPKSDRWTRITLFQGAPLAGELAADDADDWWMPVMPD